MFPDSAQCLLVAGVFHIFLTPCLEVTRMAEDQGSLLKFGTLQSGSVTMSFWILVILSTVWSPFQAYWRIFIQCESHIHFFSFSIMTVSSCSKIAQPIAAALVGGLLLNKDKSSQSGSGNWWKSPTRITFMSLNS